MDSLSINPIHPLHLSLSLSLCVWIIHHGCVDFRDLLKPPQIITECIWQEAVARVRLRAQIHFTPAIPMGLRLGSDQDNMEKTIGIRHGQVEPEERCLGWHRYAVNKGARQGQMEIVGSA